MSAGNGFLAAVVGVCDEVEIIGPCLDHLERQGVDSIVVVDMLSRDGTREHLRQRRDAGRLALIERSNDSNLDVDYFQAGVDLARSLWDPAWILLQDADEFCLAASGTLREAAAVLEGGVLQVPRFNACLSASLIAAFVDPGPVAVGAIDVWAAPAKLSREAMDGDPTLRWSAAQPAPKILARSGLVHTVAPGAHSVRDRDGKDVPMAMASDVLIVHVPFLSFARFERKIRRAKALIDGDRTYFVGATGWHWRRWIEMLDAGALEEEYRRQILDGEALATAIASGAVRPAAAVLAERAGAAI